MNDVKVDESGAGEPKNLPQTEKHVVDCPNIGPINVFVQVSLKQDAARCLILWPV